MDRAADLVFASTEFFLEVKNNTLKHDFIKDQPLCMHQYSRVLATARIPFIGRDELLTSPNSRHIVVIRHGFFFAFDVLDTQFKPLSIQEIRKNLQEIINRVGKHHNPHPVGLFTTEDRNTWATVRQKLLNYSNNQHCIKTIDEAIVVVCLDHESPSTWNSVSQIALHSDGVNRWFDKSIQLLIFGNGRSGINMEHSGYDGHTLTRYADYIHKGPRSKGHSFPSSVHELNFQLDNSLQRDLQRAREKYENFVHKTQTSVLIVPELGKKEIVKNKVSPDAFVQMAFQLAYFKLYKKFGSTYESAQTKRFYHGRTECIRSPTLASNDFVRAFTTPGLSAQEKAAALQKALNTHTQNSNAYNNAQGFERHLFGLHILSKHRRQYFPGFQIPAIFTDPTYSTLKTDLMSTSNCGSEYLTIFTFGPVCDEGLGLGYFINPDALHVNTTSFIGEAEKYNQCLRETMFEMIRVLEAAKKPSSKL